ncbi:uncharacterized protein [Antennarius striatus]|uniref:uncharacterized protein n=1 Tax=Antennarius striatus TaxID=241820 RepID=UPI0035AEB304
MRKAQQEVRLCLREAKEAYRRKLEKQLGCNQLQEVWNGMRTITGHGKWHSTVEGNSGRANELNSFFNWFSSPTTPGSSSQASPGPANHSTDAPSSCASSPSTPVTSPEPTPRTAKLNGPTSTTVLPTSLRPPAPTMTETVITAELVMTTLRRLRDWSLNSDCVYKKGQSKMYFLRRLASFNICPKLLPMFDQSIVSSVLSYAIVCWGGGARKRDMDCLNRLICRAGSVVGLSLDSVDTLLESRTISNVKAIMNNTSHPLHHLLPAEKHFQRQTAVTQRLHREAEVLLRAPCHRYNDSLRRSGGEGARSARG